MSGDQQQQLTYFHELQPLPIRVRPFDGESAVSYAHRLSAANFSTLDDIEDALSESEQLGTRRRDHPDWVQLWRVLGATNSRVFTTPKVVGGEWVSERMLCRKCTRGKSARGRRPAIGYVCLRHRRWLGNPQADLSGHRDLVRAERKFRSKLASRGVLYDSLVMTEALRCAISSCDPDQTHDMAQDGLSVEAALYPAQVAYAQFMCSPVFLRPAVRPSPEAFDERKRQIHEVAHTVTRGALAPEPERAVARLQRVAFTLDRCVRTGSEFPNNVTDDPWNLLRHLPSRKT